MTHCRGLQQLSTQQQTKAKLSIVVSSPATCSNIDSLFFPIQHVKQKKNNVYLVNVRPAHFFIFVSEYACCILS